MFKGNMSKMLKQAQEMQKRMETVQNELRDIVIDADSGGGMVNVKSKWKSRVTRIKYPR